MRRLTQVQLQLLIGSVQYCSGPQTITFISSRTSRQVVAVRLNLAENYHSFIVVPLSNTRNHPRPHVIFPLNILGCTYQSRTIFSLTVIPCPIQQNTINNTQLTLTTDPDFSDYSQHDYKEVIYSSLMKNAPHTNQQLQV